VLADIDTPEVDARLTAAKAKLNAASAAVKVRDAEAQFAKTTYARWRDSPPGVVSVQERDTKRADYESGIARVNAANAEEAAAQADVDRLESLERFKQVVAPFDGTVTARETDIGALINAGSAGNAQKLFSVADTHKVRIYVKVPQRLTGNFHPGLTAELRVPQYPGKVFTAKATTTSRSVNTSSRTLLVELQADNPDGLLQPGTYVEAQLNLPSDPNMMLIPASAILFRQHGLEVAVVGADDKVTLKKIGLGRNLGVQVEVTDGLNPSDRIVDSPPDSLGSGDVVRIAGHPGPAITPNGSEMEAAVN
jgi:RND family efflux transporter MFP subunit